MKPVKFKEVNITLGKDQPEYQPLPAYIRAGDGGEAITCWKLTLWERIKLLFTCRVYISTYTFNCAFQPILPVVHKKILFNRKG